MNMQNLITKVALYTSVFAFVLGVTVILGWIGGYNILVQLHPSYTPMQFNTALGFLLAGVSQYYLLNDRHTMVRLTSLLLLMLSIITLMQYVFTLDFGIDELFFEHYIITGTSHSGRMAPNTALCFILLSGSVLLTTSSKSGVIIRGACLSLTVLVAALATTAIIGYLTEIEQSYGWGRYTKMAMHTAIGFIVLSLGLIALQIGKSRQDVPLSLLATQASLIVLVVTISLWQATTSRLHKADVSKLSNDVSEVVFLLETRLKAYHEAAERIVGVLQLMPKQYYPQLEQHLNQNLSSLEGLEGVISKNLTDQQLFIYPKEIESQRHFANKIAETDLSETIKLFNVIDTGEPSKGLHGILYRYDKTQNRTHYSFINLAGLIASIAEVLAERGLQFSIKHAQTGYELYQFKGEIPQYSQNFQVALLQHDFVIRAVSTEQSSDVLQSNLPLLILIFGLLLSAVFGVLVYALGLYYRSSRQIEIELNKAKETSKQVSQAQKQLKLASEVSGLGVWVWDTQIGSLLWDDKMYEIYDHGDIKGQTVTYEHWRQRVHPDDINQTEESLQAALEKRQTWYAEFRIVTATGATRNIYAAATYETDEAGNIIKVIGGNKDITAQRESEQKLEELRIEAEKSNVSKSEFLANMSHEIRTPMNGVLGIAQLLAKTPLTQVQSEYIGLINKSAESLLTILNDILDYSKIEAGKLELNRISISLDQLIGEIMKGFSISAHQKGLDIHYHISPDTPDCVLTDPVRLRQIVYNLVGNAVKFTTSGEVYVSVESLNHDDSLGFSHDFVLLIKVTDTGCGIKEHELSHIFDAFSQEDGSTSRKFGGTGLGLTIAKRLGNLMHGEISVESEYEVGTTFTVKLPVSTGSVEELKLLQEEAYPDYSKRFDALQCLAVDDNAINRRWLNDMVESWGGHVTLAADADEALELIQKTHFDVMLLDYNMPDKSGIDLMDELIDKGLLRPEVIIMLSSSDFETQSQEASRVGIDKYLIKPVKQSEVFNAIQELFTPLKHCTEKVSESRSDNLDTNATSLEVLVVEDNEVNARLLGDLLKLEGHNFIHAENGIEAVEQVKKQSFDIIFMDVQMPKMDGLEATAIIRKFEKAHNKPKHYIVGLTARALEGDKEECLNAGMDQYLKKPIVFEELKTILSRFSLIKNKREVTKSKSTKVDTNYDEYTCLDVSQGLKITSNNLDILLDMLDLACDVLPKEIERITLHQDNLEQDAKVFHKIRGMVTNFSKSELEEKLQYLEKLSEDGDLDTLQIEWPPMSMKLEGLIAEIQGFLLAKR